MSSHLFVVNNDTFGIHVQNGFLGFVMAKQTMVNGRPNSAYYGQLADLMNVRKGDIAFLYLNFLNNDLLLWPANKFKPGYYGMFRIASDPFVDDKDISGRDELRGQYIFGSNHSDLYREAVTLGKRPSILPVRILIEPMPGLNYARPVDDTTAYVDKTDEGQLWTLLFKKIYKAGQARGITPLIPEEANKIARLLFKANQKPLSEEVYQAEPVGAYPYEIGSSVRLDIIPADDNPQNVKLENMLVAWMMKNIDQDIPVLRDIVGPLEDLEFKGNHIQYGISGDTVDILLLHRRKINDVEYRYKATVIEAKRDKINGENVDQALRYTKWIAQLVTFNNISAIQPVVVGKRPSPREVENIKAKIKDLNRIGIRTPIFVEYRVDGAENISFSRFEI